MGGMMRKRIVALEAILFLIIMLSPFVESRDNQKPRWKGRIDVENGITIVRNPKEPIYKEDIFILEEELAIDSNEIGREEAMFQRIVYLAVDDSGMIYVLDRKAGNIKVIDKNGKFLKIIGQRGDGPGEFGAPERCVFNHEKELCVFDSGRRNISIFDAGGTFIRQMSVNLPFFEGPKFTSKGDIIASLGVLGENPVFELRTFDLEMKPLLAITSIPMPKPPKVHIFIYYTASDLKWDLSTRGEVVWGVMTSPKYELFIHGEDGNYVRKITRDFDPTKLTKEEYEKLMTRWFGKVLTPGRWDFIIPDHYPPFQGFLVDDEGRILVKRFVEVGKSDKHYFDVFDEQGRYITNFTLDMKFQFGIFKHHRLYSIEEDEKGSQVVKRHKVTWRF
jgi:hypothetical protein